MKGKQGLIEFYTQLISVKKPNNFYYKKRADLRSELEDNQGAIEDLQKCRELLQGEEYSCSTQQEVEEKLKKLQCV